MSQVYAVIVGQLSSIVMKQDDDIVAKRAQLELVQVSSSGIPPLAAILAAGDFAVRTRSPCLAGTLTVAVGSYACWSAAQGYVKYIRVPITLKQRLTSYFQVCASAPRAIPPALMLTP